MCDDRDEGGNHAQAHTYIHRNIYTYLVAVAHPAMQAGATHSPHTHQSMQWQGLQQRSARERHDHTDHDEEGKCVVPYCVCMWVWVGVLGSGDGRGEGIVGMMLYCVVVSSDLYAVYVYTHHIDLCNIYHVSYMCVPHVCWQDPEHMQSCIHRSTYILTDIQCTF